MKLMKIIFTDISIHKKLYMRKKKKKNRSGIKLPTRVDMPLNKITKPTNQPTQLFTNFYLAH